VICAEAIPYISQLFPLPDLVVERLSDELAAAEIEWHEPYAEYATAGLKVAVLLSPDGDEGNFSWGDCPAPQVTPLLRRLPRTRRFIDDLRLRVMASRLLRLEPGAFLHEHRDYVHLEDVPRYRLHLPLLTNPGARIVLPGFAVHMKREFLWKLNPKAVIHSACNSGATPRIHLMLDCYLNAELSRLISSEFLEDDSVRSLPCLTGKQRADLIYKARLALGAGQLSDAEEMLLKTFVNYDLKEESTFDLLLDLFAGEPEYKDRCQYWVRRYEEVYPERACSVAV